MDKVGSGNEDLEEEEKEQPFTFKLWLFRPFCVIIRVFSLRPVIFVNSFVYLVSALFYFSLFSSLHGAPCSPYSRPVAQPCPQRKGGQLLPPRPTSLFIPARG